jgi:BNR repeat-like domain
MNRTTLFGSRGVPGRRTPRARLQVELLEARNLLSGLTLTPLVQVSDPSPLPPPPPSPTVFANSEVEPQIAVDPTNTAHAVAIWQQDRFRSVGGARALVVSVTSDANNPLGAHWSTPAAIPGFNVTDPAGAAFDRYTDPWVSITPNGDVYAAALALTPAGPFPGHTAVMVAKSTDGGSTWGTPTTLEEDEAPAGTDPIDLANDKESVTADPTDPTGRTVYVVWDRLNHPSDSQNFNAFHGLAFREDALFSRTTDGGATWSPAQNLTNFQANRSAFGNQIVVQPDDTLVDVFTLGNGSGNQKAQADQNVVGVMRSTDRGLHWSALIVGPGEEVLPVTDPDTGADVRSGEPIFGVAVDPNNGNLYAAWVDGRFSGFAHDDIAFAMSTDGGLTWSDPIKVNQTPTNIPAADQQAFTPSIAVNRAGTVAVTYYDFRNNDASPGLPTDYWLVHASGNFTNPASWTADEKRLTDTSFNMENAPPTSRGFFLGDYEGLAAAGNNFYALFAQAGAGSSDPSNIWFRDPPPAAALTATNPAPAEATLSAAPAGGDSALPAGHSGPSSVVSASPPGDTAPQVLALGLFTDGSNPTSTLPTPATENPTPNATPTATGSEVSDVGQTSGASAWDGEARPLSLSRSGARPAAVTADELTDDGLADRLSPEIGLPS